MIRDLSISNSTVTGVRQPHPSYKLVRIRRLENTRYTWPIPSSAHVTLNRHLPYASIHGIRKTSA